jgi:hypothetical protein
MTKKYTVSEAALRKLVKQMVNEEIEKQWKNPDGPFIDEFPEDPWAYFGQPEPSPEQKKALGFKEDHPQGLHDWSGPFQPEFNEFDTPPFLNKLKKK